MPRKIALSFLFLVSLLMAHDGQALAEKRVALIIGNSAYKNVAKLPNPVKDSASVAEMFKAAKFDVVEARQDLGVNEMKRALREFSDTVQDADIAVVYYAGHGIEVNGDNYLVPVDAALGRDKDVEDEAISLDRIIRELEPAKHLRLVILDACRDNPFSKKMKRTLGTRSIGRGLAKVEPTSSDTLIAFAAKAGSTALDGDGQNSPFTAALIKNIVTPGLDLRIAFGRVRDEVLKSTGNKQEPFVYGSLGGSTVALVPVANTAPSAANSTQPGQVTPQAELREKIRHDYELAEKVGTKEAWDSFLGIYKKGFYSDLARSQRAKFDAPGAQKPPTTVATATPTNVARSAPFVGPQLPSAPATAKATTNLNGVYSGPICYGDLPRIKGNCFDIQVAIDHGKISKQIATRETGFTSTLTGEVSAAGDVKIEIHNQFPNGRPPATAILVGKIQNSHLDAAGTFERTGRTVKVNWVKN
jgi:uncharacterized caspase-like protein